MAIEQVLNGQQQPQQPVAFITVALMPDGKIGMQGNTPNTLTALGMLAAANAIVSAQLIGGGHMQPKLSGEAPPGFDPKKR